MSHLRYVEQPPLGVGEAGPAGLTRCDSIALDFSPSQLPCTAMPVTEGSLHGQESLEERGVACQDVLGKFGFIRVFFFWGGGRRWWQRQQGKLGVLVGCSKEESLAADSAQAAAVSSENQQYCDSHPFRRRRRATLLRTLWMICSRMRRRSMVLDVSVCSCMVAGCLCSSLLCQLCPCLFLCACSAPPAQQCGGSCPAGRL